MGVADHRRTGDRATLAGQPQSGAVSLALPANFTADATSKEYAALAPGAETTVSFRSRHRCHAACDAERLIPITTTYPAVWPGDLTLSLVRPRRSPSDGRATVDGTATAGEYVARRWISADLAGREHLHRHGRLWRLGHRRGSTAQVTWSEDALYFFLHVPRRLPVVRGDAAGVRRHWQADREICSTARETPRSAQGHREPPSSWGSSVSAWQREGLAGPATRTTAGVLQRTTRHRQRPAYGCVYRDRVAATRPRPHAYAGGGYDLEVKIRSRCAAAVVSCQPRLNITPYNNDDTSAAGTTTLRHIANSTRLAVRARSVQSDRTAGAWRLCLGSHAAADRPTTRPRRRLEPEPNGALSPQTIAQSARNRYDLRSQRDEDLKILRRVGARSLELSTQSSGAGTARCSDEGARRDPGLLDDLLTGG